MRFDKYGPLDAYIEYLHPAAMAALTRGVMKYGPVWLEHTQTEQSPMWNVRHTIDIHAQCRIAQALERLDYGDVEGFIEYLGSAVGYLANAICKAKYISGKK